MSRNYVWFVDFNYGKIGNWGFSKNISHRYRAFYKNMARFQLLKEYDSNLGIQWKYEYISSIKNSSYCGRIVIRGNTNTIQSSIWKTNNCRIKCPLLTFANIAAISWQAYETILCAKIVFWQQDGLEIFLCTVYFNNSWEACYSFYSNIECSSDTSKHVY